MKKLTISIISCLFAFATAMAQDYTSYIVNPSFEKGMEGWTVTDMKLQTNSAFKTNDGKALKQGNTYLEKWIDKGKAVGSASVEQSVSGLPLGKYTLTVAAQNRDENNVTKECTGVTIYAKSTSTKAVVTLPGDYSVNFDVTSSVTATKIAYKASSATGNWLAVDNFRLTKVGDIATSTMITHITSRIKTASIKLGDTYKMAKDLKEALENAITFAGTMTADNTPDEINAAIKSLNDALDAANASITELNNLSKLIKTAEGYQGQIMQKEISDRLDAAIATGKTMGTESMDADIKASVNELTEVNSLAFYSIQAYESLAKAITTAEEAYDPSYKGAEEYEHFLTQLKEKYDARSLSTPSAKDYTARIPDIILAFRIENPGTGAPVEVTYTNPYVPTGATEALMRADFKYVRDENNVAKVLEKGICWSTEHNPTVVDKRTKNFWTLNGEIYHATGLTPATVYYLRPYIISTTYEIAYGDEVKIVTHPQGTCRGTWNEGAPDEAANTRCRNAINETIEYFNEWTGIKGFTLTGNYGAQTPTADCSYGGWMRIGPNAGNQAIGTVIHETGHGVGVGTSSRYADANLHSWKWFGREANKVYSFLENKEADPYNSDFCMVGDGTHAWGASASYDWFVNGADKDKHLPLQYAGGCILLYGMFVDGLNPTTGYTNGLPAYTYNFDDRENYYIMCKSENAGLNTGLLTAYTLPTTGNLTLKISEKMKEGGEITASDAWQLSYNAETGFYQFKNVATGRYLSRTSSSVLLKEVETPTAAEGFQLMPDRTNVTIGEKNDFKTHGYWFTWNNGGNKSMQAGNMTIGLSSLTAPAFNFADAATNQQFIIISESELKQYFPTYAPKDVKGDVDGNGTVNINDVTAVINVICGGASNKKADVDGNGSVDINDVTEVINIICGSQE